jgi:hypothetical protein
MKKIMKIALAVATLSTLGMERRPAALFAPVSISTPPSNFFLITYFTPLSLSYTEK